MNSTITIVDTDEEVIDLDVSQDAVPYSCDNEQSSNVESKKDQHLEDATQDSGFINEKLGDMQNSQTDSCDYERSAQPLVKVMFRDETVSRQYREQVKNFLENLTSFKSQEREGNNPLDLILEIWDHEKIAEYKNINVNPESDNSQDVICESLFTVDTQPKLMDDLDIPTYGKKYDKIFEKSKAEEKSDSKDEYVPKLMCFNCLANHNLRDCPEPRNQANINKNRSNVKGSSRVVRYHLDDDQRFGHMIPGQLSKNLRKALGIKDNELPRHIYRMRTLGYPPGWLEEARLQPSGISLFNSHGIAEAEDEETREILDEGDKDQYDTKKIYDFPGFNVPAPPGTHDEYKSYWAPQMQAAQSKEAMLLMLSHKKAADGYTRKKLKLCNPVPGRSTPPIPSEMEVEDIDDSIVETLPINGLFVPPLPKDAPLKPPEPSPVSQSVSENLERQSQEPHFPDSADESASPLSRTNSPSLSDLESMKKRLLVELEDSSSQSNLDTPMKCDPLSSCSKMAAVPLNTVSTPESVRHPRLQETPTINHGCIKSVDLGTPILQSTSPYDKLPSSEKFSKNICDVINFENLPDSTGKYEQMTGVLQKVRHMLAKIHKD